MTFEHLEDLADELQEAGVDNPVTTAMTLWAGPGVMDVAGPVIEDLLETIRNLMATIRAIEELPPIRPIETVKPTGDIL